MNYINNYRDTISTVQLSPFGEGQWNRIVTYSPIYVHWTDVLMMSQVKRKQRLSSGKSKTIEKIDLNSIKLEDELLLNQIYQIRKAAVTSEKDKSTNYQQLSKVFDEEVETQPTNPPIEDVQLSSSECFNEFKQSMKHHCSYAESSFANQQYRTKHSPRTNQSNSIQTNVTNTTQKLPHVTFAPKSQSTLSVQLRQSAIIRENVLSSINERRSASPLSISSSKRSISSAHSPHRLRSQLRSALSTESNNTQEELIREISARPPRAKSTNSSRLTMHLLKTKNERTKQKQNNELKTHLDEPWKQMPLNDTIFSDTIPNSLDIMHKMCGPGTAFERNLRSDFQRQLKILRSSSLKTSTYS